MDKKEFETKEELELDVAEEALETASQEEIAMVEDANPVLSKEEEIAIKKDRMRFTTNKLSSTFAIVAILLNVFYFVSLYKTNHNFFYKYDIGLSVLLNLVFMLAVFLCSEGVKKYNMRYSIALIVIGVLEIVRIFILPLSAVRAQAMGAGQFTRIIIYLSGAAALLIASGVLGVIRTITLENYKKILEEHKA